jgi:hypothetical protein
MYRWSYAPWMRSTWSLVWRPLGDLGLVAQGRLRSPKMRIWFYLGRLWWSNPIALSRRSSGVSVACWRFRLNSDTR